MSGRSRGVLKRSSSGYPSAQFINDGGHDAPLTKRSRFVYWAAVAGATVVFVVLFALTMSSR